MRKGDIVSIYLFPRGNEHYLGEAVLEELIEKGNTFFDDFEQLKKEDIPVKGYLAPYLSETEKENNRIYERLCELFFCSNPLVKQFYEDLKKECSKNKSSIQAMNSVCQKYRDEYKKSVRKPKTILNEFDNETIIKFVQQNELKNWSPTLFRLEKWRVRFYEQFKRLSDGREVLYNTDFVTNKWIRVVEKICPTDKSVIRLTTYNQVNFNDIK